MNTARTVLVVTMMVLLVGCAVNYTHGSRYDPTDLGVLPEGADISKAVDAARVDARTFQLMLGARNVNDTFRTKSTKTTLEITKGSDETTSEAGYSATMEAINKAIETAGPIIGTAVGKYMDLKGTQALGQADMMNTIVGMLGNLRTTP